MKTNKLLPLFLILALTFSATAQEKSDKTIYIKGAKFAYPLVEKWISEYKKENPKADIQIISKANASKEPSVTIIAHKPAENELEKDQQLTYVARYALLPVSNKKNPLLNEIKKNGISKKELKLLVFNGDPFDEDQPKSKIKSRINIYTRETQACTAVTLAKHFGFNPSDIKGKKVTGDDNYLISAVKKDTIGFTFNNFSNVFDLQTRKIKEDLAIVPLDLKAEVKDQIYSSNLDQAIALLEKSNVESIPVEKVSFVISKNEVVNPELTGFLSWILRKGQEYNHEQGFLNLSGEDLVEQQNKLNEKLLTLK